MTEQQEQATRSERGAVGTEMAIVVAIVVAIALALGAVMLNSARTHQECIPESPGDAGCDFGEG
jgi:uncharacterized protein HemX